MERIPVSIFEDDKSASVFVARRIAKLIEQKNNRGQATVLGLATGHTPIGIYRELIRLHREQGLDFSRVITFNLDEYWPIDPTAIQSYYRWMHENLFDHINIPEENVHLPSGVAGDAAIPEHCRQYERAIEEAGGIDLQILGIGRTGHIGFNEPGSLQDSLTRKVMLDRVTRLDAASDFFGEEHVPIAAITMGVGTILNAREIALLAFGEAKAAIIRRTVEGDISTTVAASFLQDHPNVHFYIDEAASADLARMATPWLMGPCEWDEPLKRKAVIWLAQELNKPILKLTDEDYAEHGLIDLLQAVGGAYDLNIEIFKKQMKTITGWPGGKHEKRKVLLFSPHPDDDVISMGGTFIRLVEQGHEVHVAYMVSGYLSVFDHNVSRYADFVGAFNRIFGLDKEQTAAIEQHIDKFLMNKKPGDIDTSEIQNIKGLIRRTEAIDAAKYCGLTEDRIHFLDLPFYNTGKVQKSDVGPQDVEIIKQLLQACGSEMIYLAGDMSDPHGTHRLCLEAFMRAWRQLRSEKGYEPELWFYRGAWQEWMPEQIDMAVPLSPDELKRKREAIFRHESQKDRAMFPGPYDSREFWQRAEDRNTATAQIYDDLGLPEYHAIEAFVKYPWDRARTLTQQFVEPEQSDRPVITDTRCNV